MMFYDLKYNKLWAEPESTFLLKNLKQYIKCCWLDIFNQTLATSLDDLTQCLSDYMNCHTRSTSVFNMEDPIGCPHILQKSQNSFHNDVSEDYQAVNAIVKIHTMPGLKINLTFTNFDLAYLGTHCTLYNVILHQILTPPSGSSLLMCFSNKFPGEISNSHVLRIGVFGVFTKFD